MDWLRDHNPEELAKSESFFQKKHKSSLGVDRIIIHDGINYRIASCCSPIPGDPVIGFKEEDGTIVIHKKSCREAEIQASTHGDRMVVPFFSASTEYADFPIRLALKGIDRVGLLLNITQKISQAMSINIRDLHMSTEGGIFDGTMDLLVSDRNKLSELTSALEKVDGIQSVIRTDQ